jgi:hypothetical protein
MIENERRIQSSQVRSKTFPLPENAATPRERTSYQETRDEANNGIPDAARRGGGG